MRNVAIINTQAAGDCILGTHTARLYKKKFPDSYITFYTRKGLVPTTGEGDINDGIIYKILKLQDSIDAVGFLENEQLYSSSPPVKDTIDEIIVQDRWFSDLGLAKSQHSQLISKYGQEEFSDTETTFNVGSPKFLPEDHIVISTSGPLDWNRKTKNETLRIEILIKLKKYLTDNNIRARINLVGRDVERGDLLESLVNLNNSHIYIGPMGLPVHMAAGLGLDTIHVTSVYPEEYDSPKYYHSGLHYPIKSDIHCKEYTCVKEKLFNRDNYHEGPQAEFGFWPKTCPHNANKMSCVYNAESDKVISAFDDWYNKKGNKLWTL
jgi:ADP-heptose:LPS heptosyltransferase